MKPKLIILNGPPGIGKSTLAVKYANNHPLTLNLDVDKVRMFISHWRECDIESGPIAKKMAVEMARIHLQAGYDVTVAQFYRKVDYLEELEQLAQSCNANFYEFLLFVSKEEAVKRFVIRGKAAGYPNGMRPGGIIEKRGGLKKLEQMHGEMMKVIAQRPGTIKIEPVHEDIDGTYSELLKHLS